MASLPRRSMLSALAITAVSLTPIAALSEQVQLRSADGTVNLTGEFLDFKDDQYIVRTALGDLRISASRVRCDGAACPKFDTTEAGLVIKGSDTVGLGLMPLLVSGYASYLDAEASIKATERDGEILAELVGDGGFGDDMGSILVNSTSSGTAFKELLAEGAHLGMSSRRIKPEEARALRDAGAGNMVSAGQEHIVAIDSLVVITHPSNLVQEVSIDQLRDIYSGRVTNWRDLGGANAPITVVNRQEGSGTRSVFENGIYAGGDKTVGRNQKTADDNNSMASMINNDPNAIGYVGYAFQRGAKPLSLINECGMASEPDAFSAKVEEYALQRRLYLYNRADVGSQKAQEFVEFATSAEADNVITKSGFIDLSVKRKSQGLSGSRARALLDPNVDAFEGGVMREMLSEMVNYDRLSTTFRFRTGSSNLDERGRFDMARLADFLAEQPEGVQVRFVGFTDSVGAFQNNRALSVNRAQQVIEELYSAAGNRLDGINISATGYGEVAPSGCNTSDRGRAVNRRVEVWIEAAQQG